MTEPSLEAVVPEREFTLLLQRVAQDFAAITSATLASTESRWPKRFYFRLQSEADELEVVLDDYGARHNRTFSVFTELTASIRGFALAGLSLTHLSKRLDAYGVVDSLPVDEGQAARRSVERARAFAQETLRGLMQAWWREVEALGMEIAPASESVQISPESVRFRLPRNVGQQELREDMQRIAEVASKYLQAHEMLADSGLRPERDPFLRETLLAAHCDEQTARVFEATVHNLQSAYDTYIGNTRLEAADTRLRHLRGHISTGLHLLESVTHLTHFVERHDDGQRSDMAERFLSRVVDRHQVQDILLHDLFLWARRLLGAGVELAQELLPRYTDLQSMVVELPDGLTLHARPASLVVGITTYHGTPVEMAIGDQCANASSILEVMVLVGSNPEAREYVFRGDSKPLNDIRLLFEAALGERGLDQLPAELAYLRR
ncbi:MAG TPA: HPr family phosphocarrier protein [Planctomycetota bacterium]|nr:hypothetical protein [Planctomycetota bacterium]HPF12963.1 HPr family phosphocarrier protein [Planctomycetota bacterium]HRV79848.1 HPr family phosphocarrier protein [Planctomycetota bacterium]